MRWNESVTQDFVKIYLKHEFLWNNNHPDYKLRHRRDKAYCDISTEFKTCTNISLTVPEVKMKIKNLRSTYMQEVYKVLNKSSPDWIYKPSLVWFEEMDRCLKNTSVRRYVSNTNVQDSTEVDSSCQIWVNQIESNLKEEVDPDPLIPQSDDNCDSPKPDHTNDMKDESESSIPSKKVKKKKYKHSKLINSDSTIQNIEKEDEFDIFGKYIASQLRSMQLQKALRLQLEIHSLVNEARVSEISDV